MSKKNVYIYIKCKKTYFSIRVFGFPKHFFVFFFSYFLDHHIDHGQEKRNFEDKEVRHLFKNIY